MSLPDISNVTTTQVNVPQQPVETGEVQNPSSRLSEIANRVEVQPNPEPRIHRSVGEIIGRIALGIVTVGISELVIAIVNRVTGHSTQHVDGLREDNLRMNPNASPNEKLCWNLDNNSLPKNYQNAVKAAFADLAESWDAFTFGDVKSINDFTAANEIKDALKARIQASQTDVSPQEFQAMVRAEFVARDIAEAEEQVFSKNSKVQPEDVQRHFPDMHSELMGVQTKTELDAAIQKYENCMNKCLEFNRYVDNFRDNLEYDLNNRLRHQVGEHRVDLVKNMPIWEQCLAEVDKCVNGLTMQDMDNKVGLDRREAVLNQMFVNLREGLSGLGMYCSDLKQKNPDMYYSLLEAIIKQPDLGRCLERMAESIYDHRSHVQAFIKNAQAAKPNFNRLAVDFLKIMHDNSGVIGGMTNVSQMELIQWTLNLSLVYSPGLKAFFDANPGFVDQLKDALLSMPDTASRPASDGQRMVQCLDVTFGSNVTHNQLLEALNGKVDAQLPLGYLDALVELGKTIHQEHPDLPADAKGLMNMTLEDGRNVREHLAEQFAGRQEPISYQEFASAVQKLINDFQFPTYEL